MRLAAEITRFEGFLDGLDVPKGEQAARASLRRALTAHLAYAHSFRKFRSEPGSFTDAEARTTTSLAEQAEAAYRQSANLNPTLPVIALSRADHEHLTDLVPDETPPPPPPPGDGSLHLGRPAAAMLGDGSARPVQLRSSGEVVELRAGGEPTFRGRLGSTDTGGAALAYGESRLAPGGRIRCSSSSRGITCADLGTDAASHARRRRPCHFPAPASAFLRRIPAAWPRPMDCSNAPPATGRWFAGRARRTRRSSSTPARGRGARPERRRRPGGPAHAGGRVTRTPGGTIECSSSSRGIRAATSPARASRSRSAITT